VAKERGRGTRGSITKKGEYSDGKDEGNVVKTSPYIHTRLLPTIPKEDFLPKSIFIIENALVQELKRIVSNLKNNYI